MKVNNLTRLTITLSTLCLASTFFYSANAHTKIEKATVLMETVSPKTVSHNDKIDRLVKAMHVHASASRDVRNNMAKSALHYGNEDVGVLKALLHNSSFYMFNAALASEAPQASNAINNTLAYYQRQQTNILLRELVAQQKRHLHRERLVNQLQDYLRHLSKDSAHQAVRQLVMAGQQAANVHDDATLLRHGLPNATFTQIKYWDPSVTIKRDGKSIHINPLDHTQFNQEVLFFNGDNDWQVAFARMLVKRSQLPVVLIATQGNIKQLIHTLHAPVYFAHQKTIARLGIHAVPTVVTRGSGYYANRFVFKTVRLPYHFLNQKVYEFTNAAFHSNDAALATANHAMANQHNNAEKMPVTASLLARLREAKAQWLLHPTVKSAGAYLKMRHSIEEADANIKKGIQKTEAYISQHNMHSNGAALAALKASLSASGDEANVVHNNPGLISAKQIRKVSKSVHSEKSNASEAKTKRNVNHVSGTDLDKFFDSLGYSSDTTSPEVYKGHAVDDSDIVFYVPQK